MSHLLLKTRQKYGVCNREIRFNQTTGQHVLPLLGERACVISDMSDIHNVNPLRS